MPDNTSISIATDVWSSDDKPVWFRTVPSKAVEAAKIST